MTPRREPRTKCSALKSPSAREFLRSMKPDAPEAVRTPDSCALRGPAPALHGSGGRSTTSLDRLLAVARDRGWRNVRLLASAGNTFKRDYNAEDAQDSIQPTRTGT
jgi:hypothetical protein